MILETSQQTYITTYKGQLLWKKNYLKTLKLKG